MGRRHETRPKKRARGAARGYVRCSKPGKLTAELFVMIAAGFVGSAFAELAKNYFVNSLRVREFDQPILARNWRVSRVSFAEYGTIMNDQELRAAILAFSIEGERAGRMPLHLPDYVAASGLPGNSEQAISRAIGYLVDGGLLDAKPINALGRNFSLWLVNRVTKHGYDAVEPPPGSAKSSQGAVTQHFHGQVGAVQFGGGNVANVRQGLGENEQAIIDALDALSDELRDRADAASAVLLAEAASSEIRASTSISEKARSIISGLGTLIRTLGETPAAYKLLVDAGQHAHLLPPM